MHKLIILALLAVLMGCNNNSEEYQIRYENGVERVDGEVRADTSDLNDTTSIEQSHANKFNKTGERLDIKVHKTSSCGCCAKWIEHLEENNFEVETINHDNLDVVKQKFNIPRHMHSCHTAEINGIFIEGHVPAKDIREALEVMEVVASPVRGLAVPGMPIGSPGMEMNGRVDNFKVIMMDENNEEIIFNEY